MILCDRDAHTYKYNGEFFVLDTKFNDIILGLPALTGKLLYPFMDAFLREAHQYSQDNSEDLSHPSDSQDELHQLSTEEFRNEVYTVDRSQPWTKANNALAPEDEVTELPVQFRHALTFLGKSREEAIKYYYEALD